MNTNNYTIKSQEALQNAVQLAQSKGQQAIETGHLLKAVINVGENVTHFILPLFPRTIAVKAPPPGCS